MRVLVVLAVGCATAQPAAQPAAPPAPKRHTLADPIAILEDDDAPHEHWFEGAMALTAAEVPRDVGTRLILRRLATPGISFDSQCALAYALVVWDFETGERIADPIMRKAIVDRDAEAQATCVGMLASARGEAGSATALADYAQWIVGVTVPPTQLDDTAVAPLLQFPRHPAIVRATVQLFADGSRWLERHVVTWMLNEHERWIEIAPFNTHLVKHLAEYVRELSQLPGAPKYRGDWPPRKRAAALRAMTRWVKEQVYPRALPKVVEPHDRISSE